jgi:hypothetical protein
MDGQVQCQEGLLHVLYVVGSYVLSSGGRTSTLGILIVLLDVYAAKQRHVQWCPRYHGPPPHDGLGSCDYCQGFESMSNKVSFGWNHVAWHQETQETALASVIDLPFRHLSLCERPIPRLVVHPERRRQSRVYTLPGGYDCVEIVWLVLGGR